MQTSAAATKPANSEIISAVKAKDVTKLRALLDRGGNPNAYHCSQEAIIIAIKNNDLDCIYTLIKSGAHVSVEALFAAIKHSPPSTLFGILSGQNGKKFINCFSYADCLTPLMFAASTGKPEHLSVLLSAGADHTQSELGEDALYLAFVNKHKSCIVELLRNFAKVTEANKLIHHCAHSPDLLHLLAKNGADFMSKYKPTEETLLMSATGNLDSMRLAMEAGNDINAQNEVGRTALMFAISKPDSLRMLLAAGANLEQKDNNGETALSIACSAEIPTWKGDRAYTDRFECIQILIAANANVNTRDKTRRTPLLCLIDHLEHFDSLDSLGRYSRLKRLTAHQRNVINTLHNAGANLNAADSDGKTALMAAVRRQNQAALKHLIALGADVNATDNKKHTAILYRALPSYVVTFFNAGFNIQAINDCGETIAMRLLRTDHTIRPSYLINLIYQLVAAGINIQSSPKGDDLLTSTMKRIGMRLRKGLDTSAAQELSIFLLKNGAKVTTKSLNAAPAEMIPALMAAKEQERAWNRRSALIVLRKRRREAENPAGYLTDSAPE